MLPKDLNKYKQMFYTKQYSLVFKACVGLKKIQWLRALAALPGSCKASTHTHYFKSIPCIPVLIDVLSPLKSSIHGESVPNKTA